MSHPTQRLGTSDLELTRTGLGAWALSGSATNEWGTQDDELSIATIHRAVELGIGWVDTAPVYGFGHSEAIVGRALAALPEADRPLVFTKVALERLDHTTREPIPSTEPVDIRAELETSLRHLGMDHVDLYQVHWPPNVPPTPLEEYWRTMVELRAAGKVRAIGLSNHDVGQLERAEAIGHVDSLQQHFSMVHRAAATEIAWCEAHGAGVLGYSPQHHGLLTGAFSLERVRSLPEGDWRRSDPDFTDGLPEKLALADALKPIAERHGVSRAAVAIAWTHAWPGFTAAIAGARRPDQIDDWVASCELQLTEDDLDEIAAEIERSGVGDGPPRPPGA